MQRTPHCLFLCYFFFIYPVSFCCLSHGMCDYLYSSFLYQVRSSLFSQLHWWCLRSALLTRSVLFAFFSLNLVKKALWLTDKRISSLDFPFLHDWRPMVLQSSHICSSVARRTEATFNKLPAERTIKAGGCMWSQLSIGFFNVIVHQIRGRNMKSISAVWSLLSLENPCSRVAYCTNKQRQSAN